MQKIITVKSCVKGDPTDCYSSSTHDNNITVYQENDKIMINPIMTLPEDKHFDTSALIKYDGAGNISTDMFATSMIIRL